MWILHRWISLIISFLRRPLLHRENTIRYPLDVRLFGPRNLPESYTKEKMLCPDEYRTPIFKCDIPVVLRKWTAWWRESQSTSKCGRKHFIGKTTCFGPSADHRTPSHRIYGWNIVKHSMCNVDITKMFLHSVSQRHVSALPKAIFSLITFSFARQPIQLSILCYCYRPDLL
jgi:hypothetical protein